MTSQKCSAGASAVRPARVSSRTHDKLMFATPMVEKSMPRDLWSSTGRRLVSRYPRKKSSALTMNCKVCSVLTDRSCCTGVVCVSCSKKSTVMNVSGFFSPILSASTSTLIRRSSKMFSPGDRSAISSTGGLEVTSCAIPSWLERKACDVGLSVASTYSRPLTCASRA